MTSVGRLFLLIAVLVPMAASSAETLRLGILKFGTVAWELDTIRHHGLDRAEGVDLQVTGFAGKQAAAIAFQGGEVDAIVTDFIWVARQHAAGRRLTFAPYSATVGALMVPPDGGVASLADLKGKRIGIAGGPLDKSWLLLQAVVKQESGLDLKDAAEPLFGAPPLLRKQFEAGQLDALVTFWHYAARLEAAGYRRLADMDDLAQRLGGDPGVALLGYVFSADANPKAVAGFLKASRAAKQVLLNDDAEWARLRPLTRAKSDAELAELKRRFRDGIQRRFQDAEIRSARTLFSLLAKAGGERLTGGAADLPLAAFHPAARF